MPGADFAPALSGELCDLDLAVCALAGPMALEDSGHQGPRGPSHCGAVARAKLGVKVHRSVEPGDLKRSRPGDNDRTAINAQLRR